MKRDNLSEFLKSQKKITFYILQLFQHNIYIVLCPLENSPWGLLSMHNAKPFEQESLINMNNKRAFKIAFMLCHEANFPIFMAM